MALPFEFTPLYVSLLFLQFLSGRLFCPGLLSYFGNCFSSKRSIAGFFVVIVMS